MNTMPTPPTPEFDAYATDYDAALNQGIAVSGESKEYFAKGRVDWLASKLDALGLQPRRILDFGCGTGTSAPMLTGKFQKASVLGVDISKSSIETARKTYGSPRVEFKVTDNYQPAGEMDLAFCNGVFHHIPLAARAAAVETVWRALRPNGIFAFWENNPWNPGTRYVMSRIPFDRDAITLSPPTARHLLEAGSFKILRTDFLFVFPRSLSWFRKLESHLSSLPLGAQYLILATKLDG